MNNSTIKLFSPCQRPPSAPLLVRARAAAKRDPLTLRSGVSGARERGARTKEGVRRHRLKLYAGMNFYESGRVEGVVLASAASEQSFLPLQSQIFLEEHVFLLRINGKLHKQ